MELAEVLTTLKAHGVIQGKVEMAGMKVEVIFKPEPYFQEQPQKEPLTHDEKVAAERQKEDELLFHSSSY
jgi:hypothetical protein